MWNKVTISTSKTMKSQWKLTFETKCYAFIQLAYVLNSVLAANGVAKLWPNMCFMVQTFYYQIVIMTWKYDVNLDNLISSFLSPSYICEILKRNFLKVYMIRVKKQTHHPQLSLTQRHKNISQKKFVFWHFPRKHELHKFWVRVRWLQVDAIYVRQIFIFFFFLK